MTAPVEIVVLQEREVVEQTAGTVGVRRNIRKRIGPREERIVLGIEDPPKLGRRISDRRPRRRLVEAVVLGVQERIS